MIDDSSSNIVLFRELMKTHGQAMQRYLGECGLYRGQHFVLFYLIDHPGTTQIEMAQLLGITKASVGATIARMEKNGLILRTPDKNDARCNRLFITSMGESVAADCHLKVKIVQSALFSKFSTAEESLVKDVLERMLLGLKDLEIKNND